MENDNYKKLLDNFFKFSTYSLSENDRRLIKKDKAKWVTNKLCRKKFRKTKLYKGTYDDILSKVKLSIEQNTPINLIILFGGYKHFWNTSHPNVDWAELFNLKFMTELVAPILEVYKPGVILDYASEDVIISKMNNYPKSSLDSYASSFKDLIDFYSDKTPTNFKINYIRTGDRYNKNILFDKIDDRMTGVIESWSKLTIKERKSRLKRSVRSFMFNGEIDYSNLDDIEKNKLIEKSKQVEDLFYEIEYELINGYYDEGTHIPLVLSWGLSDENFDHWLTLGSTFSSSVDFWIGRGILEIRGDKLIPRIVSNTQYKKIKSELVVEKVDLGLKGNFKFIEVFKGQLEFKK